MQATGKLAICLSWAPQPLRPGDFSKERHLVALVADSTDKRIHSLPTRGGRFVHTAGRSAGKGRGKG